MGGDTGIPVGEHGLPHQGFVFLVGASVPREVEFVKDDAHRRGLLFQQFGAHSMVADPVIFFRHRGQERGHGHPSRSARERLHRRRDGL